MTLWCFRAHCLRVVDGDTLDVTLDLGFHLTAVHRLRLLRVNTPEPNDRDPMVRAAAHEATTVATDWIRAAGDGPWPLRVHTEKSDSFGRWLAEVTTPNGDSLNQFLLDGGFAVPYVR